MLGKQWKEESPAVRDLYKAQALERKAEHLRMYPDYQYAPRKPGEKKRRASRKDMEAGSEKEEYDTLRFIDQEGVLDIISESGSGVGDDDMDVIGTKVDEGVRRFHLDGDFNVGLVLPVSDNTNVAKMVDAHNKRATKADGTTLMVCKLRQPSRRMFRTILISLMLSLTGRLSLKTSRLSSKPVAKI